MIQPVDKFENLCSVLCVSHVPQLKFNIIKKAI